MLTDAGIPVRRIEQQCEEFIVIFPGAAVSSISCGYNVAESIHCASPSWLATGVQSFKVRPVLVCLSVSVCLCLSVYLSLSLSVKVSLSLSLMRSFRV